MTGGYSNIDVDMESTKTYMNKLELVDGLDQYEIPKNKCEDNVDLWLAISYVPHSTIFTHALYTYTYMYVHVAHAYYSVYCPDEGSPL